MASVPSSDDSPFALALLAVAPHGQLAGAKVRRKSQEVGGVAKHPPEYLSEFQAIAQLVSLPTDAEAAG